MTTDTEALAGPNLNEEASKIAADVLQRVLQAIDGRSYSPRIKLLSLKQVSEATGYKPRTLWRMINEGRFPQPQNGLRKAMWREATLIAWMDANDPNQQARRRSR